MPARTYPFGKGGGAEIEIMYYVYVLYSAGFEKQYVGMSDELDRRLAEHNSGKNQSTKTYKPWSLIHKESFDSRVEARIREKYLKTAAGRRWRKNNLRPRGATE